MLSDNIRELAEQMRATCAETSAKALKLRSKIKKVIAKESGEIVIREVASTILESAGKADSNGNGDGHDIATEPYYEGSLPVPLAALPEWASAHGH